MPILNEKDRDIIVLASTIRGGIKCVRTTERRCGYIIRVELRFPVINEGTGRALKERGLPVRNTYTKPNEITSILHMIKGLEELSATPTGLKQVRELNGEIIQPTTHSEVLSTLTAIEAMIGRGFICKSATAITPYEGQRRED